ncbi:MAG: MerR family transcriptional regulator [Chloroflexota bacterium]
MKSSAAVTLLNMAESTIRKYANEYIDFLSPSGTGGGGKHRDYTDHDVRVLKLIRDMKTQHVKTDDIDITLRSLQSGGWDRLPALDTPLESIIPAPVALSAANKDRDIMKREIELLNQQIVTVKTDAQTTIDRKDDRINELERKLARAELKLELYESGDLKPKA